MIPYGRQEITTADVEAVVAVLRSDFLTQGPVLGNFEDAVAARVNCPHAVATSNATAALHIACLALELGPGDRLWTVPNTFVASANCGRYCGADVDFVDIDARTWNISTAKLKAKLASAKKEGTLPKVVVPVHFAGQPPDQDEIADLAGEYGFRVLEDASHAIGASRDGEPVGSCRWSDITVFSFHPVKIITTGEGGMAVTRDDELARRLRLLRSHGITRHPAEFTRNDWVEEADRAAGPPSWYYEQQLLGYNYRMTDIQAALGVSQLERLESYVQHRNEIAKRYDEALRDLPLELPLVQQRNRSAFHLYVVRLAPELARTSHREMGDRLRALGIGVNLHYAPVHLQPYYRALGFNRGDFPVSEAYARSAISLPMYPGLDQHRQEEVVDALRRCLKNA